MFRATGVYNPLMFDARPARPGLPTIPQRSKTVAPRCDTAIFADERARNCDACDALSSQFCTTENVNFRIKFLRQLGLVGQAADTTMTCSPYAVCTLIKEKTRNFAAVEVTTRTAVTAMSEAKSISRKFGQIVVIDNIGRSADSTRLFQSLIVVD